MPHRLPLSALDSIIQIATSVFPKPVGAYRMMESSALKGKRCGMILDRRNLVNQTSARLDRYRIPHGIQMVDSTRYRPSEPIQICSAQTLERRGSALYDVLFIDECHQTREATKQFLEAHPHIITIGLSATPLTKGLGKTYGAVVCPITTNQLVDGKLLVMPRIFCATEINMDGAKKVGGEWSSEEIGKRGIKITGDIISTWNEKTRQEFGGPVKTIVHCASVDHGADIAERFRAVGHNFVALSYRDDEDFKLEVYQEFAKSDSKITGIIAVDLLTKGFDVPDVKCSIMARPFSKSVSSVIQQCGRVMRTADGKYHCILIDHAGNFIRHRDQIMDIFENGILTLDDGAEKPAKEKSLEEKEAATCPKCQTLWMGGDTCACCGYQRPRRSTVEEVDGKISEIELRRTQQAERQSWYGQLLHVEASKGYKRGWALHCYRDKFGCDPAALRAIPEPVQIKVQNWIKHRQIRHFSSVSNSKQ